MRFLARKFVMLILASGAVAGCTADSTGLTEGTAEPRLAEVHGYLARYGYLAERGSVPDDAKQFRQPIRQFQRMAGLPQTGELDPDTMRAMAALRCGHGDFGPLWSSRCPWESDQ